MRHAWRVRGFGATERWGGGDAGGADGAGPFLLGLVGDSGSGKSTVAAGVRALLGAERTTDLPLEDYQRFTRVERAARGLTSLHLTGYDLPLLRSHLQLLRRGRPVRLRGYHPATGDFGPARTLPPHPLVLARGPIGFPTPELREAYDLAVFLHPEPELLFRWKLRHDVRERGLAEAEVLKYIVRHLLDSKEFVLPQAALADVVVQYSVPEWDAPDHEVRTTLRLRRAAAAAVAAGQGLTGVGGAVRLEEEPGGELLLHLEPKLDAATVEAWARERFPACEAAALGLCHHEEGPARSGSMALVQLLLASLVRAMRTEEPASVAALTLAR